MFVEPTREYNTVAHTKVKGGSISTQKKKTVKILLLNQTKLAP